MLNISGIGIRRLLVLCSGATALLIGLSAASAQVTPGQQAAAQAQQATAAANQANQAAQQANQAAQQGAQDAQQANQQATQAAQQAAAMNTPVAGPPHRGYGRADKPTFSPRPGAFQGPVHVTISDPTTPKSEIFYTVDGSEPTISSTRYTGPVMVTSSTKLRAIARSPIYSPSRVANANYVIH